MLIAIILASHGNTSSLPIPKRRASCVMWNKLNALTLQNLNKQATAAKRYASADGHFGPFRRLTDTDDHSKR